MAEKEISNIIKLQIEAGKATPLKFSFIIELF